MKKPSTRGGISALPQCEAKVTEEQAEKRRHVRRQGQDRRAAQSDRAQEWPRRRARSLHALLAARAHPSLDAPQSPVRVGPGHRRRERSSARRGAKARRGTPTGARAPGAAAARRIAIGTASRRPPRARRRQDVLEGRCRGWQVEIAQRRPKAQDFARRHDRLHRVLMADIVEAGRCPAMSAATGAPPHSRRPAAGASKPPTSRNKLVLPLPLAPVRTSAPPAGRQNETPANTSLAPRRHAKFSAISSEAGAGTQIACAKDSGKKGGSGGGIRSRFGHRPIKSTDYEVWGTNL